MRGQGAVAAEALADARRVLRVRRQLGHGGLADVALHAAEAHERTRAVAAELVAHDDAAVVDDHRRLAADIEAHDLAHGGWRFVDEVEAGELAVDFGHG